MSKAKANTYSASNVDSSVVLELRNVAETGIYDDLTPVVDFVKQNGLVRTFGNIVHFTSTNEIGILAMVSEKLVKVLDVINYIVHDSNTKTENLVAKSALLDESAKITDFYSNVCSNMKVFYKIFSIRRPKVVLPFTAILTCLVEYKNMTLHAQFLDSFDLGQQCVEKLFVPSRDDFDTGIIEATSMRHEIVRFWLALCSTSSPTYRKALLTNFRIMKHFWKYMELERYEVLNEIMDLVDKHILSEQTFKKATKTQILNENFVINFKSLFAYVQNENPRDNDKDDHDEFLTFKKKFIEIMNTIVADKDKGLSFPMNDHGFPIVVHNVTFKINNKLIYTLLTALRPWDAFNQMQLVMRILNNNSELVPPYMNWLVSSSGGYHEPALSSYWIGHTLLYTEILKSPSLPVKADFIALLPLSRSAMTECLAFPSDLIKQLSLQLILLQLQKLDSVKGVTQSLKESVLSSLPAHSCIIPLLSHSNKLIKLTATMVIATLEKIAPKSSSSATVSFVAKALDDMNSRIHLCESFELTLLDQYLSIQSNNELKWWNKTAGGNSFFTSLLKLSDVDFLKSKIFTILEKLTKPTLVFNNKKVIDTPIAVLIEACSPLVGSAFAEKVWTWLDETVARAIKTPYKYLDQSHLKYEDVSIFLVVLFEQAKYVKDFATDKELISWTQSLVGKMIVLGESQKGIEQLIIDSKLPVVAKTGILKSKNTITSKLEFAETVALLNRDCATFNDDSQVFKIITKLGNFLMSFDESDPAIFKFLSTASNWNCIAKLGGDGMTDKEVLAALLFNELLLQLDAKLEGTDLATHIFSVCMQSQDSKMQMHVRNFLWILSDEQILEVSKFFGNQAIALGAHKEITRRKLPFTPNFAELMKIEHPEADEILKTLVPSPEQIEMIVKNSRYHFLLEQRSLEVEQYLLRLETLDDELLYRTAPIYPSIVQKYKDRVIGLALSLSDWEFSLSVFNRNMDIFELEQLATLVMNHPKSNTKDAMTTSFVEFIRQISQREASLTSEVELWFHRCMLYVTKKFAESETLSSQFRLFLKSLESLITSSKDFSLSVPVGILNAQLEVLLVHKKWVKEAEFLEYSNSLILSLKGGKLANDRLLNLYMNNAEMILKTLPTESDSDVRFQSALAIHSLYFSNQTANMTILLQILSLYLGSLRAEDLLLKSVLSAIEKKVNQSWVSHVSHWDFSEEITQNEMDLVGQERLIIQDSKMLVVALNRNFLNNTLKDLSAAPEVPKISSTGDAKDFALKCFRGAYHRTVYDPEFLMLVLINNEELASESEGRVSFHVTKMVTSGFLQMIVASLALDKARDISKIILQGILKSMVAEDSEGKDKNIMRIYVSSILHTIKVSDHSVPIVWFMIGSLANILANPGHFLYETVYRYVLSTPVFKPSEVPLFQAIMLNAKGKGMVQEDNYYKQVIWLVTQMSDGVKTADDLKVVKMKNALEWLFNICNSKYAPEALRYKLLSLLYNTQNIVGEGCDLSITKHAGLTTLESMKRSLTGDVLSAEQQRLNVDQLALRFGISSVHQKRVREWAGETVEQAVKRIHNA